MRIGLVLHEENEAIARPGAREVRRVLGEGDVASVEEGGWRRMERNGEMDGGEARRRRKQDGMN